MRKLLILLGFCALTALFSCTPTAGVDVTHYYDAGSYYRLEVSDGMNVTVTDEVDAIVITADENIMEKIVVKSSHGTLRIYRKDFSVVYINTAKVLLPYNPNLTEVTVSYDSEFSTPYGIEGKEGENVAVKLESRSKFHGYLLADKLKVSVLNHSEINATFDVYENLELEIADHSNAFLDGYTPTVNLKMTDNSTLERLWNGNNYAFMCDYCLGTMKNDCVSYIDCDIDIAMELTNNCFLHFTSHPDLGGSYADETSGFVDDGE